MKYSILFLILLGACSKPGPNTLGGSRPGEESVVMELDSLTAKFEPTGLSIQMTEQPSSLVSSIDFGSVPKKVVGKMKLVMLNPQLTPQVLNLNYTQLAPFIVESSNCPVSLAPRRSCVINLALNTNSLNPGEINQSLSINENVIPVTASVAAPIPVGSSVAVSPATLNFGTLTNSPTPVKKKITIFNPEKYEQALNISASQLVKFTPTSRSNCPAQLKPKRSCVLEFSIYSSDFDSSSLEEFVVINGQTHSLQAQKNNGSDPPDQNGGNPTLLPLPFTTVSSAPYNEATLNPNGSVSFSSSYSWATMVAPISDPTFKLSYELSNISGSGRIQLGLWSASRSQEFSVIWTPEGNIQVQSEGAVMATVGFLDRNTTSASLGLMVDTNSKMFAALVNGEMVGSPYSYSASISAYHPFIWNHAAQSFTAAANLIQMNSGSSNGGDGNEGGGGSQEPPAPPAALGTPAPLSFDSIRNGSLNNGVASLVHTPGDYSYANDGQSLGQQVVAALFEITNDNGAGTIQLGVWDDGGNELSISWMSNGNVFLQHNGVQFSELAAVIMRGSLSSIGLLIDKTAQTIRLVVDGTPVGAPKPYTNLSAYKPFTWSHGASYTIAPFFALPN